MTTIQNKLSQIKEHIGLDLNPCDYFSGLMTHNGNEYFNVILEKSVSESAEYDKLSNLAKQNIIITKVEPNGHKRLALFF